jgi:hypothetical protein
MVSVATVDPLPVQPDTANLVYVTEPVTPVVGNPPTNVAETVVEPPTVIGEVAAVVREVIVVLLTISGSQLLVDGA